MTKGGNHGRAREPAARRLSRDARPFAPELDFKTKLNNLVRRKPYAWLSGAALPGLVPGRAENEKPRRDQNRQAGWHADYRKEKRGTEPG